MRGGRARPRRGVVVAARGAVRGGSAGGSVEVGRCPLPRKGEGDASCPGIGAEATEVAKRGRRARPRRGLVVAARGVRFGAGLSAGVWRAGGGPLPGPPGKGREARPVRASARGRLGWRSGGWCARPRRGVVVAARGAVRNGFAGGSVEGGRWPPPRPSPARGEGGASCPGLGAGEAGVEQRGADVPDRGEALTLRRGVRFGTCLPVAVWRGRWPPSPALPRCGGGVSCPGLGAGAAAVAARGTGRTGPSGRAGGLAAARHAAGRPGAEGLIAAGRCPSGARGTGRSRGSFPDRLHLGPNTRRRWPKGAAVAHGAQPGGPGGLPPGVLRCRSR